MKSWTDKRPPANDMPWCSIHSCRPNKCWEEHNPKATHDSEGSADADASREASIIAHRERQAEQGYSEVEFHTKVVYTRSRRSHDNDQ